ncbi:hypothetical protein JTE90_003965 [Oedothorax gibbosus]|uniref:Uncharacterized protein n=1 Tax=Oedothorax gibbosus TaxID=931172 RepID=A0AAV6UYF9_9ARAC|nr:hypothetical protein JTE90_003965 [Oedothorax gibbosus]
MRHSSCNYFLYILYLPVRNHCIQALRMDALAGCLVGNPFTWSGLDHVSPSDNARTQEDTARKNNHLKLILDHVPVTCALIIVMAMIDGFKWGSMERIIHIVATERMEQNLYPYYGWTRVRMI